MPHMELVAGTSPSQFMVDDRDATARPQAAETGISGGVPHRPYRIKRGQQCSQP